MGSILATAEHVMASNAGPAISSSQAGQVTVQHAQREFTQAEMEAAGTIVAMLKLPAGHRIVNMVMFNDDLDTGATGAVDIGVEDTVQDPADTTDLTLFAIAQDVQTLATVTRFENEAVWDFAAANYDRYVIIQIETVSATGLPGGVSLVLTTRPELGTQFE